MFKTIDVTAIRILASRFLVPLAWLLGLAEVESAGRAFWNVGGKNVPPINLEGHYFYRLLSPTNRAIALRSGLCNPVARKTKVPSSYSGRYAMLLQWMAIDRQAALESISMGVGQVMGEHWRRLGFKSVDEMWDTANGSLAGQVEIMCRFIVADPRLLEAISARRYATVAAIYNGPAYKINKYDEKLANAVNKWSKSDRVDVSYQSGSAAEMHNIKKLGFDTVEAFQRANGLTADGIIGPITRDKVQDAVQAKSTALNVGAVATVGVATTGAIGIAISEVTDAAKHVDTLVVYLKMLGGYGPSVAGIGIISLVVGVTAYSFYRSAQNAAA